jgi:hypothetical protein
MQRKDEKYGGLREISCKKLRGKTPLKTEGGLVVGKVKMSLYLCMS